VQSNNKKNLKGKTYSVGHFFALEVLVVLYVGRKTRIGAVLVGIAGTVGQSEKYISSSMMMT
jgi:hypothetical protein